MTPEVKFGDDKTHLLDDRHTWYNEDQRQYHRNDDRKPSKDEEERHTKLEMFNFPQNP